MEQHAAGFLILYTTCPDQAQADLIARTLVEERVAACANIIPGVRSWYSWQGNLTQGQECIVFIKTSAALADQVQMRIRQLHSYACPCIVQLPIVGGEADYLAWVGASLRVVGPQAT